MFNNQKNINNHPVIGLMIDVQVSMANRLQQIMVHNFTEIRIYTILNNLKNVKYFLKMKYTYSTHQIR